MNKLSALFVVALGVVTVASTQEFEPLVEVRDSATDRYTDHGNGVRSKWKLQISEPLSDKKGNAVRAVAYGLDFFPTDGNSLLATTDQLVVVRSELAEEIKYRVGGVYADGYDQGNAMTAYTISFKPRDGFNWADVRTVDDYTARVTTEQIVLPQ